MVIYLDSGDFAEAHRRYDKVDGYTTNPTLFRKAGVTDYLTACREFVALGKPVSLEVIADDPVSMEAQARTLASLGPNVVVKIPITNTRGEYTREVIQALRKDNIKINVTAVMTEEQVKVASVYSPEIISIFCGRIQDTGINPYSLLLYAKYTKTYNTKLLWASARHIYSVKEAESFCDIITLTPDLLAKIDLFGKDLTEFSLETVRMFKSDADKAGYVF